MGEHEEQQEELHSPISKFNLITYIRTHTLTPVYGNTVWYLVPSTGCEVSSVVGVESPDPRGRAAGVRKYPGCYTMVCDPIDTRVSWIISTPECLPSSQRTPQLAKSKLECGSCRGKPLGTTAGQVNENLSSYVSYSSFSCVAVEALHRADINLAEFGTRECCGRRRNRAPPNSGRKRKRCTCILC